MSEDRYDDRQLQAMADTAASIDRTSTACEGLRNLLIGKSLLLKGEIEREHAFRKKERSGELAMPILFPSPQVQIVNLKRWNERFGWGFNDGEMAEAAARIPPEPPAPPVGKLQLVARVLEIHLPDLDGMPGFRRTFDALWDVIVAEQGMRPCHLFGLAKDVRLALSQGHAQPSGLTWRTIDLGAHWPPDPECARQCGTAPRSLPPELERPHAGILAAAAHAPAWLARMDGRLVPYVWLPGYELSGVPHAIPFAGAKHHPCLSSDGRKRVFLYYQWDHVPFENCAIPVYADVPASRGPAREGDGFGG